VQGVMPPLRAVSIFGCWACAALLLPGCDGKGIQRSGVKVPECPPHPMESLPEQTRRDTPLKSWIAAGIEVKAQPSSSSPPTARVCGGNKRR